MDIQDNTVSNTPIDDQKIIDLYWARNERAIIETERKYKKYLYTVAYNIVRNRLDCEECLNDTYLGVWNSIPPTRPNSLKAYLTVIMRRISINRYYSNSKKGVVPSELTVSLSELEGFLSNDPAVTEDFSTVELGKVLSAFLRSLSERKRFIFMSRYYLAEPIDTIAGELDISRSTVNKELAAIRALLSKTLECEGYKI